MSALKRQQIEERKAQQDGSVCFRLRRLLHRGKAWLTFIMDHYATLLLIQIDQFLQRLFFVGKIVLKMVRFCAKGKFT